MSSLDQLDISFNRTQASSLSRILATAAMIRDVCFVIFIAYLNIVQGSVWKTFQNDNNVNKLMHILSKSRIPIRDQKEQNEASLSGYSAPSQEGSLTPANLKMGVHYVHIKIIELRQLYNWTDFFY